jgi:ABC-type multidrug transport system fused ATPase/permease subunit
MKPERGPREITLGRILGVIFGWRWEHWLINLLMFLVLALSQSFEKSFFQDIVDILTLRPEYETAMLAIELWALNKIGQTLLSVVLTASDNRLNSFLHLHIGQMVTRMFVSQDMSFFEHYLCGCDTLINKTTEAGRTWSSLMHEIPFQVIRAVFDITASLIFLEVRFRIDPRLIVLGLMVYPPSFYISQKMAKLNEKLAIEGNNVDGQIMSATRECLLPEHLKQTKMRLANDQVLRLRQRKVYIGYDLVNSIRKVMLICDFILPQWNVITSIMILLTSANYILQGSMTWGEYVAFSMFIGTIGSAFQSLLGLSVKLRKTLILARNVAEMVATPILNETFTRDLLEYDCERPRWNDPPHLAGSWVQHILCAQANLYGINSQWLFSHHRHEVAKALTMLRASSVVKRPWSVEFKNVSFSRKEIAMNPEFPALYDKRRPVARTTPIFQNFSCAFPAGKFSLLSGQNGSGKSTLIELLGKLYAPDDEKSDILVDSKSLGLWKTDELRLGIGYAPQQPPIRRMTILENIFFGKIASGMMDEQNQGELLSKFFEWIQKEGFPLRPALHPLRHVDGASSLSGGEQQQLSLLSVFMDVERYSILILDEPTNHIDAQVKEWLFKKLLQLKQSKNCPTVIIIAHGVPGLDALADHKVHIEKNPSSSLKGEAVVPMPQNEKGAGVFPVAFVEALRPFHPMCTPEFAKLLPPIIHKKIAEDPAGAATILKNALVSLLPPKTAALNKG